MSLKVMMCLSLSVCLSALNALSAQFRIVSVDPQGNVTWTNAFTNGVCTIESVDALVRTNVWQFQRSVFTSNSVGQALASSSTNRRFFHAISVDVSTNTPLGNSNLVQCYGRLRTIAGNGSGATDNVSYWKSSMEGGYATNAALSRPHHAIADTSGNILIIDKNSHALLKVTPDGRIHTIAGTHVGGFNGDGPAQATILQLNQPNGLYIANSHVVYILDTGNGKVRRLDTNNMMSTLFTVPGGVNTGRGLWVDEGEAEAVFCDGTDLKAWNRTNGVSVLNSSFTDLGNVILDTPDTIIATDRGDSTVWSVQIHGKNAGKRTFLYGNGKQNQFVDATSAVTGSLYGVRGVWKTSTGGYLLASHEGCQVIYVDAAKIGHIWLDGQTDAHSGDGQWFHTPGYKISQARSVSVDNLGNIIVVESDSGYVRGIEFRRMGP